MAFVRLTTGEITRTSTSATRRLLSRFAQSDVQLDPSKRLNTVKSRLKALEKDLDNDFELPGIDPEADNEPDRKKRKKARPKPRLSFDEVVKDELGERAVSGEAKLPFCTNITVGPSRLPPRKFCSICGFFGPYTCTKCGSRFCCLRCKAIHDEQRCMKCKV
eukprot:RCo010124